MGIKVFGVSVNVWQGCLILYCSEKEIFEIASAAHSHAVIEIAIQTSCYVQYSLTSQSPPYLNPPCLHYMHAPLSLRYKTILPYNPMPKTLAPPSKQPSRPLIAKQHAKPPQTNKNQKVEKKMDWQFQLRRRC